jgi:hypothetical protein
MIHLWSPVWFGGCGRLTIPDKEIFFAPYAGLKSDALKSFARGSKGISYVQNQ